MNKTELKQATAAVSGLSLKDVSLALAGVLHVIETTLQQGDKVVVPGFGAFVLKERSARMGRNPRTGKQIEIAAKKVVKFTPGNNLTITDKPRKRSAAKKK